MKKMRLLLCMFFFVSILFACEAKEEKKTIVCTEILNQDNNKKVTLKADGDKMKKSIEEFSISIAELEILEEDLDTFIKERLKELYGSENEEEIKGEYEIKDGIAYLTFTIDYTKADLENLIKVGFVNKGNIDTKNISLEQSIKSYKNRGYICK